MTVEVVSAGEDRVVVMAGRTLLTVPLDQRIRRVPHDPNVCDCCQRAQARGRVGWLVATLSLALWLART